MTRIRHTVWGGALVALTMALGTGCTSDSPDNTPHSEVLSAMTRFSQYALSAGEPYFTGMEANADSLTVYRIPNAEFDRAAQDLAQDARLVLKSSRFTARENYEIARAINTIESTEYSVLAVRVPADGERLIVSVGGEREAAKRDLDARFPGRVTVRTKRPGESFTV